MINKRKIIFSIIIPHYNNIKDLKICLSSIYNQDITKDLYEVIVVDDCSLQNPKPQLKKYITKYNNFILSKLLKNSGPGIARNQGIKLANGEYIMFVDSDDILNVHALKILLNLIKKGYETITFNYSYKSINRINLKKERKDQNILNVNKSLFIKKFIGMNYNNSVIFTIFKRSLLSKNNIKFLKGFHEDIPFIFQIYYFSNYIYFENKVLYIKKNRSDSIVNTYSYKKIKDYFNSWEITKKIIIKLKGIKYYKKNIELSFTSGLVGLLAIIIMQNIQFNKYDNKRLNYYIYICKLLKKNYLNVIIEKKLPNKTIYDRISYNFITNFFFKDHTLYNMKNYEYFLFKERYIEKIKWKK